MYYFTKEYNPIAYRLNIILLSDWDIILHKNGIL